MLRLSFGINAKILTDPATTGDRSTDTEDTSLPVARSDVQTQIGHVSIQRTLEREVQ